MLWGCRFDSVVLCGKIGAIKLNLYPSIDWTIDRDSDRDTAWKRELMRFYDSVQTALDITAATVTAGMSLHALPGDKIQHDPTTAVLIDRATWAGLDIEKIQHPASSLSICIEWFLAESPFATSLLVASGKGKQKDEDLAFIDWIRSEGLSYAGR